MMSPRKPSTYFTGMFSKYVKKKILVGCDFLTLFSLITHLYEVLGSNNQYILKEESEASILTFGLRLFDPALFITGMKCEQENIST